MRNWSCDIWLFNFCNGIVKHLHIMKWQNHFINHNVHNYHETLSCNRQLCLWMCHVHTVYVYIFMYMYVQCIISPLEHWFISDGIFTPTQLFPIREDWGLRGREITRMWAPHVNSVDPKYVERSPPTQGTKPKHANVQYNNPGRGLAPTPRSQT